MIMSLVSNTRPWREKVGPLRFWFRMLTRQFMKRVFRRGLLLRFPNRRTVWLPENSQFSSVAWVTKGAVDDGFEVLLRFLGEAGTAFFDVGAHFGFYCAFLCDRHEPCVAFEPDIRTLPSLRHNLATIPGAICIAAAVSDRGGELRFIQSTSSPESRILGDGEQVDSRFVQRVPVVKLDEVWRDNGFPKVGVMKIDTEGHEASVLSGGKLMIEANQPLMLIEATAQTLSSHTAWLNSLGYVALTLSARHHARPQQAAVVPLYELGLAFQSGMILMVPEHVRSKASWQEVISGRFDFAFTSGNWRSGETRSCQ
jgi:FkbM family methyltransferase